MRCAWDQLLSVLPLRIRAEVDKLERDTLQEIRLRKDRPVCLRFRGKSVALPYRASMEDLQFVVNTASKYSPWAASTSQMGYITASGGHRIGICGECVIKDGRMTGFRQLESLCVRVARDIHDIAPVVKPRDSVLILGPPGSGKTTLLRDMIRSLAASPEENVTVVDERGELFPSAGGFDPGLSTDILTGCDKKHGIMLALRTMNPKWIAVDEITQSVDAVALQQAIRCGVKLMATAHASTVDDLYKRKIYRPLAESGMFHTCFVLDGKQSWRMERITK